MSETVKETVRACVARASTGALADIERETDAIMALLPQVWVKELEWETGYCPNGRPFGHVAKTIVGTFQVGFEDGAWACLDDGPVSWEWEPKLDCRHYEYQDLTVPRRACEVKYAEIITSALVQPPGVVSDAQLREILEDEFKTATATGPAIDRTVLRITAALASPVSEGEMSPTPDIPREEPTVRVQIHGGGVAGVDESIAPLVKLLNDGGVKTAASCSGHSQRPGNIALSDGRELIIARNWNEARLIDGLFPGINGEPARGVDTAKEFICQSNEEIRADERERLAKLSEAEAYRLAAKTEAMSPTDYVGLNRLRDRATWLRSLTNGDG